MTLVESRSRTGYPSLPSLSWVKKTASLTSRVRARRPRPFPAGRRFPGGHGDAGAVDGRVELVRRLGWWQRDSLRAAISGRGPGRRRDGGAAGLGRPLGPLGGQPDPGQLLQQARRPREGHGGRGLVVHRGQARRHGRAGHAELGVPRREAVPALRAVVPGPRHRDQTEHRVERLVPVAGERGLVPLAARDARSPVPAVSGQQLLQHAPAQPQQPSPDHRLRSLHPGIAAAQDPGRLAGQPP